MLRQVDVPEGKHGAWAVERFTVSEQEARFETLRAMIGGSARPISAGTYTRLRQGNHTVMSDTPMEMDDHWAIAYHATGRVLIAGLGLGVVLQAVAERPTVTHVRVVENAPDVIALVWPHYLARYGADRISLVEADARALRPRRGERWDAAWFDIWPDICGDYAPEMKGLARRWRRRVGWFGCWAWRETLRAAMR